LLLATGKADLDMKDQHGYTPLMKAVVWGHKKIVELLLATGKAGLNTRDRKGDTPLIHAILRGHQNIVSQLLATLRTDPSFEDMNRAIRRWADNKNY
jgi:ankyrin repeat protein